MTRSYLNNNNPTFEVDAQRLPLGQVDAVMQMAAYIRSRISNLTTIERAIYTTFWSLIARVSAPIVARNLNYKADVIQTALDHLIAAGLLWYDNDLRAVLQCPPFSALHTPHEIKAFGWDRAYVCSFIDAPLALLLYGPNTWMDVRSVCPRSGEILQFRVRMSDSFVLRYEAPADAAAWRMWGPANAEALTSLGTHGDRANITAYHTEADLMTDRHYAEDTSGAIYTLDQAIYVSQCLLSSYQQASARPVP